MRGHTPLGRGNSKAPSARSQLFSQRGDVTSGRRIVPAGTSHERIELPTPSPSRKLRRVASSAWMFANRARGRPVGFLARKAVDLATRYLRTARAGVGLNPYQSSANAAGKLRFDLLHDAGSVARALDLMRQSRPEDLTHVVNVADRARR